MDDVEIINQNNGSRATITLSTGITFPRKLIFNGDTTIMNFNNKKIVVRKDKEDKYDPVYAFLYGFFLYNGGLSKTQASKLLKFIEDIAEERNEEEKTFEEKIEEVEDIIAKNLDFDTYVKQMNDLLKKK